MQNEQKMMDKIKALILKAESTDSQEEKDAFMMKAQELIQKHNIDASRIMAVRAGMVNGIFEEAIIEEIVKYEDFWDRELMKNVAKGNMCEILYNTGESQIHIIGKESNCAGVLMMCDFYRKAILNLALDAAKRKSRVSRMLLTQGGRQLSIRDKSRIESEEKDNIRDYLLGAVNGLKDALEKKVAAFEIEKFVTEDSQLLTGGEVMKVNRNRAKEYIEQKYGGMLGYARLGNSGGNQNSASYGRGYNDGGGLGASQKRLG